MAFAKVWAESAQLERAAEILRTRLRERGVEDGQGYEIRLVLDPSLAENAFRLKPGEIAAADLLGAVHGCGRFLQGCEFPENGFVPMRSAWKSRHTRRTAAFIWPRTFTIISIWRALRK